MEIKGIGWEFGHRKGTKDNGGWGQEGLFLDGTFILGSGANWDGSYEGPNDEMEALILAALKDVRSPG